MPLRAIPAVAKSQNGVGAFILQCKRLEFHFCDWAGSSRGMNSFIRHTLPKFARENPQIEITVSPRPNKHPVIKGHYINGREKAICVRNLEQNQVLQKAELLKNANGEKLKKVKKPVISMNESVRGVWSGLHGHKLVLSNEGKEQ
ncbi:mitochondrial ribosomal protein subunit L51 [Trichodelitschia bisporula]|uniref:Large ribosomal subunit protein mL43 n=1 Tax=Trichodelitschia bisporula TaxID=703511 RepID=A0A6G1HRW2_9PEZI|nr:mitochondrial ribosomal protein subunit L51 [Trichodelitschia bisporula]